MCGYVDFSRRQTRKDDVSIECLFFSLSQTRTLVELLLVLRTCEQCRYICRVVSLPVIYCSFVAYYSIFRIMFSFLHFIRDWVSILKVIL